MLRRNAHPTTRHRGISGGASRPLTAALLAVALQATNLGAGISPVLADYEPGIPSAVDPGAPPFTGSAEPVPPEPTAYDPSQSMLEAIYEADLAAGGTSFWFDRILARPFLTTANDPYLLTRGRALYMYNHNVGTLGFAGGWAYRERPANNNQSMYTISISGASLTEATAQRMQYPSHWTSVHTTTDLSVGQTKFITEQNIAVTLLTIANTGATETTRTITASSALTNATSADGTERTGTVATRYELTTVRPRFSGDQMAVSGTALTRSVTLPPGGSVTLKVQLGALTDEIPESASDYERYRGYDGQTAFLTHLREYNRWWVDNVPYIDIADQNIKKMVYYRTFLNRYNYIDANVPGNDYQFPVSIEGVLGYNNAIQLTQPMHLQDLKYFRDPLRSYGNWVSSGETSKCTAFTSNPGSFSWGNTYEQYIAREAWQAYKVHGGDPAVLANLAQYAECDIKGQLAKYDLDPDPNNTTNNNNNNSLIAYGNGALTGNDADAVALAFYQRAQDRTETAFWYSGARAAAEAYAIVGNQAKADEMNAIADNVQSAILNLLWDDSSPEPILPQPGPPATRVAGVLGNALPLSGAGQYVSMPNGIVNGLNDFTISTWVNPQATSTWARIFDIGTGTASSMFLTINGGGNGLRFAITTSGGGGEQQINRLTSGQLPLNTWSHVAVTLNGNVGTLYLGGTPIGTNTNITLRPSGLGDTTNSWIGRSQYSDPLLNASLDDFQIYDRALSAGEVVTLAGGAAGAGNVASYRFDEADGNDVLDSSGNDRHATVIVPAIPGDGGGKVFKQRDVLTGELVPWKDQQNFSPFTEGVVPNTDDYKLALRFFADAAEFPIMPFYTADQADKAAAVAAGRGGSNNFSNINSTLQAQLYSKALRDYPTDYITPDMYRRLIEWLSWVQYVGGDNRFPDNNEFFFNWDPTTQTLGRSGIHHNILGAYNFMIVEDVAGFRPRLDNAVELWPIDMGYSHFTVNNLRYHGQDLTIVWDRPGDDTDPYPNAPEGYSAYLDGQRVFTVDDLAHVAWDAGTGTVAVLDGTDTAVSFNGPAGFQGSTSVRLRGNARIVDLFQKAGVDLTRRTGWAINVARGKPVTASFTATTPALRATAPEYAVDGWTISGLPAQSNAVGYLAPNTIWGTEGSPNTQDWIEIDLGVPARFDTVKLYWFSDKAYNTQSNGNGNTYRQPSDYSIQVFDGTSWVDVTGQVQTPFSPLPNYNTVEFPTIEAQRVRVLATRTGTFGIGLKEIQVFDTDFPFGGFNSPVADPPAVNSVNAGSSVPLRFSLGIAGDQGLAIFAAGFPQLQPVTCGTTNPVGSPVPARSNNGLQYDPIANTYAYVWKTDKSLKGSCGRLDIELIDGNTYSAYFRFK